MPALQTSESTAGPDTCICDKEKASVFDDDADWV